MSDNRVFVLANMNSYEWASMLATPINTLRTVRGGKITFGYWNSVTNSVVSLHYSMSLHNEKNCRINYFCDYTEHNCFPGETCYKVGDRCFQTELLVWWTTIDQSCWLTEGPSNEKVSVSYFQELAGGGLLLRLRACLVCCRIVAKKIEHDAQNQLLHFVLIKKNNLSMSDKTKTIKWNCVCVFDILLSVEQKN